MDTTTINWQMELSVHKSKYLQPPLNLTHKEHFSCLFYILPQAGRLQSISHRSLRPQTCTFPATPGRLTHQGHEHLLGYVLRRTFQTLICIKSPRHLVEIQILIK